MPRRKIIPRQKIKNAGVSRPIVRPPDGSHLTLGSMHFFIKPTLGMGQQAVLLD